MHTQNVDFKAGLPDAAHQHSANNDGQIDQVNAAVNAEGLRLHGVGIKRPFGHFFLEEIGVDRQIDRKQNGKRHE